MTEWLRSTSLVDFALGVSEWPLSMWMVNQFWAIPILQMTHILGIAMGFGSLLMITAKVFGIAGHSRTVAETSARYIPWMWWSLAVIVLSGGLMLFGDTVRNLINAVFWIKMILVVGAILISIWFHKGVLRRVQQGREIGSSARVFSVVLVVMWCMIMFGGRWIAYAPA